MKLILLGPPGVGKGTHGDDMAERYGIPKISTGDILRDEVKNGTELGLRAKKYMDGGKLVPDELVIEMLKKRISQPDCQKGFILDGFPRTLGQAEALGGVTKIDLAVNFVASKETIIQRITNRWTCKKCKAIYNTISIPPKQEGLCDKCGGELFQRDDQKLEVVKERLETYERETEPLIDFYKNKGLLADLDAEGEKEVVSKRAFELMGKHFPNEGE